MLALITQRALAPPSVVFLIALFTLVAICGGVVGFFVGLFSRHDEIVALRAALCDAYMQCSRCKGYGTISTPGATLRCPSCARWRLLVERTS